MGAAQQLDIRGAKGGGSKPKQPTEAPDSLQSTNLAKILIAVGEGEFEGTPTAQDIYLDNTPIQDSSGNVNFPNVKWDWRSGSIEQTYIPGIPAIENETTVNVELRSDNPWSRALSNIQLSAVRLRFSWPRLASQDEGGNTNGYRIEYAIDVATDGGSYQQVQLGAVDGKTTNGYQRSVRVDLPKATSGWMIRVRRITPNQNSGTIADTMTVAGYTEIIDRKLRYPNTALLYIEFDAQQFQNIPAVTVKCKARKWPVPANYDPLTRTYTGVWDGSFKQAWTNNPAFVTYGLCVEDRFGLGKRIKSWMVDKWEMYRIAQYCDQLVPDGIGGQEPRFLCDMNLQGRAEAWTLLRDLSAIYRGMVYWAQGSLFMQADMPRAQDIDYVFTRFNVIDGEFTYGGAEKNTHYSRALVSYDNPANNYDTDVIPVTDLALQRRYRDRPIEISAIGCTRASEAQRRGKWILLSNSQDRTVTFRTGMEGRIPLPGYVIPVADELIAGRPNGGRIAAAAGRVVTLDRDTQIKAGDRLIINLPNGRAQGRTVESVSGRAVTVTTAYSVTPEPELQWAIDADDLAIQLFRVLRTARTTEGDYEITALEFNPSKFAHIDTGARLEERPISIIPITVVPPPASVTLTSNYAVDQGIAVSTMTIAWPAVNGAVAYDVEWRKDNGNWIKLQRTGATSVDVTGIYAGAYLARVRAVSAFDISSIWKSSNLTQLTGKAGLPPSVSFLNTTPLVYGIKLAWGFPAGAEDTQRTEIWYSATTSQEDAIKLGDFAYPQAEHEMHGLAAGVSFFFWARLIDRTGNIGPWYPAGVGVNGQSSSDESQYDEYFKDKIGNGALYPELREEIALISGPPTMPGSVNERLKEINDQLQEQIDTVAELANSMPYNPDEAYALGQAALGDDGKLYQAKQAVPKNTPPPNTTYWTDIGEAVRTANGLAARVITVENKVTEQDGKLTAQAERIDGVQTSLNGKADASTVDSIGNRVTQTEQGLTSQGSAITGLTNQVNNIGGDNLLPNSSFEEVGSAGRAKYWLANGGTGSLVDSSLAQSKKAQRVYRAGAALNELAEVAYTPTDGLPYIKVREGASYVLSAYARGTNGKGFAQYLQFINASGGVISTAVNQGIAITDTFKRYTLIATAPAGAVSARPYVGRVVNNSATVSDIWIEVDNVQLQEGAVATAYTASTEQSIATQAAATQALSTRVEQTEQGLSSQSVAITELKNGIGNLGAAGMDAAPAGQWQFDTSVEGWGAANATISQAAGSITVTATAADPNIFSPLISINGSLFSRVKAKVTRRAGAATDWDGSLFYSTAAHPVSGSYFARAANPNLAVGESAIIEWDMANLQAGGNDWVTSTITRIRIDLGAAVGGSFEVDWIVVGRLGPSASSTVVQQMSSEVSQQGTALTAQAQRLDGLFVQVNPEMEGDSSGMAGQQGSLVGVWTEQSARVEDGIAEGKRNDMLQAQIGDNSASVQQLSEVMVDINGKVSAQTTIKAQTTVDGRTVMAALALGSDGETSEILAFAQRFAIVDQVSGELIVPFVVQDGQVFISQALIGNGWITNAMIGNYIQSNNYVAGLQGWRLWFNGTFEINSPFGGGGRQLINNAGGKIFDQNNQKRYQWGDLSV